MSALARTTDIARYDGPAGKGLCLCRCAFDFGMQGRLSLGANIHLSACFHSQALLGPGCATSALTPIATSSAVQRNVVKCHCRTHASQQSFAIDRLADREMQIYSEAKHNRAGNDMRCAAFSAPKGPAAVLLTR